MNFNSCLILNNSNNLIKLLIVVWEALFNCKLIKHLM